MLLIEPNKGVVLLKVRADEKNVFETSMRKFLKTYEELAKNQRHRGKLYPVTGVSARNDVALVDGVERANQKQ